MHTQYYSETLKLRDSFGNPGADERMILKWMVENRLWRCGFPQLMQTNVGAVFLNRPLPWSINPYTRTIFDHLISKDEAESEIASLNNLRINRFIGLSKQVLGVKLTCTTYAFNMLNIFLKNVCF